jgi:NitT/TauT family transport system ATP-binding protein
MAGFRPTRCSASAATARPGRIKTIVPVDLPRPRNLFSREAEAMRIQLTDLLRDEVDRAFAEQEAMGA